MDLLDNMDLLGLILEKQQQLSKQPFMAKPYRCVSYILSILAIMAILNTKLKARLS